MFVNMGAIGELFEVTFTIYLNDTIVNSFQICAPRAVIEVQFISLATELIAQKPKRMKLVLSRDEIIWDKFEQRQKVLNPMIEFENYGGGE